MFKKRLTIYAIGSADDPGLYFGYTASKKQAHMYFDAWLRLKWSTVFETWCHWNDGDPTSDQDWVKFCMQDHIQNQLEKYRIYKLKFSAEALATLMRMQDMSIPLNLPFIPDIEKKYYMDCMADYDSVVLNKIKRIVSSIDSGDEVKQVERDGE